MYGATLPAIVPNSLGVSGVMPSVGPAQATAMASIATMKGEDMTPLRASLDTRFTRE